MSLSISELKHSFPRDGQVKQILVRPEKFSQPLSLQSVKVTRDSGLEKDHYSAGPGSKRQVTLIQYEHLPVIASMVGLENLDAGLLRRNIVVAGINLLALKECIFSVGTVHLKMTGLCHPCSRMERALGPGGYNAMRGHGGINASVIQDGVIKVGDSVSIVEFV